MNKILKVLIVFLIITVLHVGMITLIMPQVNKYVEENVLPIKSIVSAEEFRNIVFKNGMNNVQNVSEEELDNHMLNLELGVVSYDSEEYKNQVNYWKFKDKNYANFYFYKHIIALQAKNEGIYFETQENYKNGNKYTLKTKEKYYVLYLIDDVMIYIDVELENEELVNKILEEAII